MSSFRFFIPSAIYYGLIFLLSSQSRIRIPLDFPSIDKILHFFLYAGFGLCLRWGFARIHFARRRGRFAAFLGFGITAAVLDEVHQLFVPGRNADPGDALFDVLGILAGWFIVRGFARFSAGRRWFPPDPRS